MGVRERAFTSLRLGPFRMHATHTRAGSVYRVQIDNFIRPRHGLMCLKLPHSMGAIPFRIRMMNVQSLIGNGHHQHVQCACAICVTAAYHTMCRAEPSTAAYNTASRIRIACNSASPRVANITHYSAIIACTPQNTSQTTARQPH